MENAADKSIRPLHDVGFLQTKISIPRLQAGLIPRSHLLEHLDDYKSYRSALISAPAGFGKTTLIAGWIRRIQSSHSSIGFAWLSLDERDNDPARFWSYVIHALQKCRSEVGSGGMSLLGSPQSPPLPLVLDELINDLSFETSSDMPIFLVLDDYHLITEATIHEHMAYFMDNLPPDVYAVIATRTDPPLPLSRWRARRQLLEIRQGELRFALSETADFLAQTMNLNLQPEDVAILDKRTEGWIAGLQLAALSLREREDHDAFLAAFNGSHRHVLDYLSEEVLARLPQPILEFICQTSILQRLSGSLCDAVTSRNDSSDVLEWLEQHNLFLSALDDERRWFRYHNLFLDMLRSRLKRAFKSEEIAGLHQRASAWLDVHGWPAEAIDHALAGGEPEAAADLMERNIESFLLRPEHSLTLQQIEALPKALIERRAKLCLAYAVALTSNANFLACESWLTKAEVALGIKADSPDTAHLAPEVIQFLGWIDAFRATIAINLGDHADVFALAERALTRLPRQDRMIRCIVALNLGDAYADRGENRLAEAAFEEAIKDSQDSGNLIIAIVAMGSLGTLKARLGKLRDAYRIYQEGLELSRLSGGLMLPAAGKIEVFLADLLLEWNDLAGALRQVENGILHCRQWGHQTHLADGLLILANIQFASGNPDQALKTLHEAEQTAQASQEIRQSLQGDPSQGQMSQRMAMIMEVKARFALELGHIHEVETWAGQLGLTPDPSRSLRREDGTYARLLMALNRPQETISLLKAGLSWVERLDFATHVLRVKTQLATALYIAGDIGAALTLLADALHRGEPEGFVRSFLNEGPVMEKMLQLAAAKNITPDYSRRLLTMFKGKPAEESTPANSLIEPLTERELEVLRLLSAGRSNPEIASELFLAVGTVKKHINNIFGKLSVASRTQALLKARDVGLI